MRHLERTLGSKVVNKLKEQEKAPLDEVMKVKPKDLVKNERSSNNLESV